MEVRAKLWEVMPFTMMVMMEGCTVGLTIMAKTAMSRGMSPFVFVVYTNALSSIILLPYSLIFRRDRTELPLFTLPLLLRFFFLGLIGITIAQNLAFMGLNYSSPILACGIGNLIPAFSFVLAIILRTTRLDWRRSSGQAKLIGTLISIMGAILLTLYKGPAIKSASFSSPSPHFRLKTPLLLYSSTPEHWVLGGLLLAAASLSVSVWNIIQVGIVKQYPEVMTVLSFYSLVGTIQCAVVSLIAERNPSAWRLKLNMELLVIVLTAIFGSVIRSRVHIWCTGMKGPIFVPVFKPLGIAIAVILGAIFFADSLHYGSVMGACIIGMGYYTVIWGQIREDEAREDRGAESVDSPDKKVPLLQEEVEV